MVNILQAQFCTGSLGDPIINITFGSGGNPGQPMRAATTSYNFTANDCPDDGFYTIRNRTTSCFSATWHSITDHTGDPEGYFMLVNASFQPGDFYVDTIKGLCANTTYEFSSMIMNVIKPFSCNGNPTSPNITFRIEKPDGVPLETFYSGDIPASNTPLWRPFGAFFTTPPGVTSVIVRMRNNAPGGCGNDLALDDITFRPCGPTINPTIEGLSSKTYNRCQGADTLIRLSASVSAGYINPVFQWQQSQDEGVSWMNIPSANNTVLTINVPAATPSSTRYRLTVAESINATLTNCMIASDPVIINVHPIPVVTTSNTGPACIGDTITLSASGGMQYAWGSGTGFSGTNPQQQLVVDDAGKAGNYWVIATSADGCTATDTTVVALLPSPVAMVAFTDTAICLGTSIQLSASGGSIYHWLPATGLSSVSSAQPMTSPDSNTVYMVAVTNLQGCTDTAGVMVKVIPAPAAHAGADKTTSDKAPVQLQGSATGHDVVVEWWPHLYLDDPFILQPFASPTADTVFVLTVTSANGCGVARDTVRVKVFKTIVVPNAFSPNNDGINDVWKIPALQAYPDHRVTVFNRYGNKLFQTSSFTSWDGNSNGKPLPPATYYYLIAGKDFEPVAGSVTIIK